MSMASISSSQGAMSGVWAQLQEQQAQRAAEQAEVKARALKSQADVAQATAEQAQEKARTLKVQSSQADGDVREARMNLVSLSEIQDLQTNLADLRTQLAGVTEQGVTTAGPPVSVLQPVVNAEGQTTGTLLSVTA